MINQKAKLFVRCIYTHPSDRVYLPLKGRITIFICFANKIRHLLPHKIVHVTSLTVINRYF